MRFEVLFEPGEIATQVTYHLEVGVKGHVPAVQREWLSTEEHGTLFDRDSGEFPAPGGLANALPEGIPRESARAASAEGARA